MITNTKFYQKYKEGIVCGLMGGLFWGLAGGLAGGLIGGLVGGLLWGLLWGLVGVLAGGLIIILVNWSEAFPFLTQFREIAFVVLGIIILIELFYWFDKEKPKGKATTYFIIKKKFEATCEVLLGFSAIAQIYVLIREGSKYLPEIMKYVLIREGSKYLLEIMKWVGYIGIVIGIVWVWVQLNKLKY